MLELAGQDWLRERLGGDDQSIQLLVREVYDRRSRGEIIQDADLRGEFTIRQFTHVFEEYNEVILAIRGTNVVARVRDGLVGLRVDQVFHRTRMVPVEEWVTAREL